CAREGGATAIELDVW
nr:immunoglobulin heavy chain junction region [Macaca mulatta]